MATYNVKYRLFFKDVNNDTHRIDILPKDYVGAIIDISEHGYSQPFVINIPTGQRLDALFATGATIRFYTNGSDYTDLYTIDPFGVKVRLYDKNSRLEWAGYVNPESYSEPYDSNDALIEITCNDGLAALDRVKYFTDTYKSISFGRVQVKTVLASCLSELDYNAIYLVNQLLEMNANTTYGFIDQYVNLANYVDEDGESMSRMAVLSAILGGFGLSFWVLGEAIWIFHPGALFSDVNISARKYNKGFNYYWTTTDFANTIDMATGQAMFLNASQNKSIIAGFNRVVFRYSPYPHSLFYFSKLDDVFSFPTGDNFEMVNPDLYVATSDPSLVDAGVTVYQDGSGKGGYAMHTKKSMDEQSGINWLGIEQPNNGGMLTSIKIAGGWVNCATNNLAIKFKVMFASREWSPEEDPQRSEIPTKLQFKLSIKIGNKWGSVSGAQVIMNNNTETFYQRTIALVDETIMYKEVECVFFIQGYSITDSGNFEIAFKDHCVLLDQNNTAISFNEDYYAYLMFKDFEVMPAEKALNTNDIETFSATGTAFIAEHKVDVLQGQTRSDGHTDRGSLWYSNTLPSEYWKLTADTLWSNKLSDMLSRMWLSQYKQSYLRLTGTIAGCKLFSAGGYFADHSMSNTLLPVTCLKDTTRLGTRRLLVVGGNYDVQLQEFEGTFDELFETTETIA